jgi:hypothetical protein
MQAEATLCLSVDLTSRPNLKANLRFSCDLSIILNNQDFNAHKSHHFRMHGRLREVRIVRAQEAYLRVVSSAFRVKLGTLILCGYVVVTQIAYLLLTSSSPLQLSAPAFRIFRAAPTRFEHTMSDNDSETT